MAYILKSKEYTHKTLYKSAAVAKAVQKRVIEDCELKICICQDNGGFVSYSSGKNVEYYTDKIAVFKKLKPVAVNA